MRMAPVSDSDDERPALTLEEQYVGEFLPDGLFAIQEVSNPHGWLVSDTSTTVEE